MAGLLDSLWPAVQQQESGNDPNAVSPVGAFGLAQLMPATAANPGFGIAPLNPADPNDNARLGQQYLGAMLNRYNGDATKALVAYNWGPGNADKWNGNIGSLPKETQNYVSSILGSASSAPTSQGGAPQAPAPQMASSGGVLPPNTGQQPQDGGILASIAQNMQNNGIGGGDYSNLGPMLLALGAGIASGSGHGWGAGIGAGLSGAENVMQTRLANRFKLAELMSLQGFRQGQLGNTATANAIKQQTANQTNPMFDFSSGNLQAPPPPPGAVSPQPGTPPIPAAPGTSIVGQPPVAQPATPPAQPGDVQTPVPAPQYDEKFLSTLPPFMQQRVMATVAGDIPPPNMTRNNPVANATMNSVLQYTGGRFDAGAFARKNAMLTDATSGPMGDKITAGRTLIGHLQELVGSIGAMNNGPSPAQNEIVNNIKTTVGGKSTLVPQANLSQLRENLNAAMGEAAKVWAAGEGSEGELNSWKAGFNEYQPKSVQLAAVAKLSRLAEGKFGPMQDQIQSAVPKGSNSVVPQVLTPATRSMLTQLEGLDRQQPTPQALNMLKAQQGNPSFMREFESRYGPATQFLGGANGGT